MKIKLNKAIELLKRSSAVLLDGTASVPNVWGETTMDFLQIGWTEEGGEEFCVTFNSEDNQEVEIVMSSMFLVDNQGEIKQIILLKPWGIESEIL
jgi:hypothetical protein